MPGDKLMKSPLYDRHVAAGAKMGEVAGWSMPLNYGDPAGEAEALRTKAVIADVSHYGRIRIRGDGGLDLLEQTCVGDVAHQEESAALAVEVKDAGGATFDHAKLLRLEDCWVLITSPENRAAVLARLTELAGDCGAKVDDQTAKTVMFLLAGPEAAKILDATLPFQAGSLADGAVLSGAMFLARYIAERTDAFGAWGARVQLPGMFAGPAWKYITEKPGDKAMRPVGLDALKAI